MAKKFVPSTDEVGRLQRGTDPECVFFQAMANKGHNGGGPGSRQGIYVCSPSGKFLASINTHDPDRVLRMMEEGLRAWRELPADEKRLADSSRIRPSHRWEDSFPSDGLVLRVINRDLPEHCDPSAPCEVKWNQDQVWFSKAEARGWVADDPQVGDVHAVSPRVVSRLARFHFVDSVKGQTGSFSQDSVEESSITTRVVDRVGSRVKLAISGATTGANPEGWWQSANGVVTRVLGQATFDLEASRFVDFEIVALGRRFGHTRFNGRRSDGDSGPLGYVLRLAPEDSYRVAPAAIARYSGNWVRRP